ncbi:nucleotide exchange factor GrpE [Arthrobacter sp. Hz1]
MTSRGQEPNESTDDAVWQDLVSRLEQTPSAPEAGTAPALDSASEQTADVEMSDQDRVRALFENQPRRSPGGPRDYTPEESDDEDEGYHPPEPPALGAGEPLLVLAWFGAVGGPITLLLLAMFWRAAPLTAMLGVLAIFLVSVIFLILRLPKTRDHGDNGAEV